MLISEFVKDYQTSKQQNAYVKKQIKTNYVPYLSKIEISKNIVKSSMYKDVNGKDTFVINSPLRYNLFVQSVIDLYTNLEWDKRDDGTRDIVRDFDLLEEHGLVEAVFNTIGNDIQKFTTVLNMVVDDEMDLNRSMVAFLETKYEALSMFFDVVGNALEDPRIKDKIANLLDNK